MLSSVPNKVVGAPASSPMASNYHLSYGFTEISCEPDNSKLESFFESLQGACEMLETLSSLSSQTSTCREKGLTGSEATTHLDIQLSN